MTAVPKDGGQRSTPFPYGADSQREADALAAFDRAGVLSATLNTSASPVPAVPDEQPGVVLPCWLYELSSVRYSAQAQAICNCGAEFVEPSRAAAWLVYMDHFMRANNRVGGLPIDAARHAALCLVEPFACVTCAAILEATA